MCMADGGESAEIYRSRMQRTRKPRQCEECRREIAVGERYHYAFMVYEGNAATFATCEHCGVGQAWLIENCGGFVHGGTWEDLEEHIVEYRRWCPEVTYGLTRLKLAWRRKWRRFDGDGLMAVPAVPSAIPMELREAH